MATDKHIITVDKEWADCYICEDVFLRKRKTKRYCNSCDKGFCEGEHGSFTGGRVGICLICNTNINP